MCVTCHSGSSPLPVPLKDDRGRRQSCFSRLRPFAGDSDPVRRKEASLFVLLLSLLLLGGGETSLGWRSGRGFLACWSSPLCVPRRVRLLARRALKRCIDFSFWFKSTAALLEPFYRNETNLFSILSKYWFLQDGRKENCFKDTFLFAGASTDLRMFLKLISEIFMSKTGQYLKMFNFLWGFLYNKCCKKWEAAMLEGRLVVFVSTETFLSTGNKHEERNGWYGHFSWSS